MKRCETCGKPLKWGEEFTVNGAVQCEDCMRAQIQNQYIAYQQSHPTPPQPQPDVKATARRSDSWVGVLRVTAIVEMIVGIIAAVIVGASLADVNGGMAVGVIFGGIAGAVVAAAPMMVLAGMAERQEEMRALLAQQLELQKAQMQQPAPPQG
ncbi:MAG: hypothetical protein IJL52_03050 [Clostridia bacterium]|nr:hypothetical protein [Clostridia bacterium]